MNDFVSKALAWCAAHWELVCTLLTLLAYAWLNAKNARTAIEKRAGSRALRVLDAVSIATMEGAKNKASAPLLGKSIADAARAEIAKGFAEAQAEAEAGRATQAPPSPDASGERASAGFAELGVVGGIVGALGLALFLGLSASLLSGCPALPKADGCTVGAVRCSEQGVPQTCDVGKRWTPMDDQCSAHEAQCCVTNAYSSRVIATCLPMSEVCHAAQ